MFSLEGKSSFRRQFRECLTTGISLYRPGKPRPLLGGLSRKQLLSMAQKPASHWVSCRPPHSFLHSFIPSFLHSFILLPPQSSFSGRYRGFCSRMETSTVACGVSWLCKDSRLPTCLQLSLTAVSKKCDLVSSTFSYCKESTSAFLSMSIFKLNESSHL